jgi:hypothetical protein
MAISLNVVGYEKKDRRFQVCLTVWKTARIMTGVILI